MDRQTQKFYIDRLNSLVIENGEITKIEFLEKDDTVVNDSRALLRPLPARCNVYYTIRPSVKSDIKSVISLPIENWNGRFLGTGNGGAAGTIVWQNVNGGVARYFATANTDMGSSVNSSEMYDNPQRWEDFGHRATHLMTVVAKQIIKTVYGKEAEYSYFLGGSTGGCQAIMQAQRYPEDYDGIVAFCPAYNRVNLHQEFIYLLQAVCGDASGVFKPEQIVAVHNRVIERFAEKSGSAPGDTFISYPGKVKLTPDDIDTVFDGLGLNDSQLNVLKSLCVFPKKTNGEPIYESMPWGCESSVLTLPYIKDGFDALLGFLQRWAFGDKFDYKTFDFDKDYRKMQELFGKAMNATNPDLSAFKAHGAKLIMISGSTDCLIPYSDTLNYYKQVTEKMGGADNVTDFFKYFHVPGLAHGTGGTELQEIGCGIAIKACSLDSEHDALSALMSWRENNIAPKKLIAVGFINGDMTSDKIDMERPIYPYPYETEYVGGDRKKKESFRKKLGNGVY